MGRWLGAIHGRGVEQIARRRRVQIPILTPSLHMDLVNPVLKEARGLAATEQGVPHWASDSSKCGASLSVLGGQEDHRPQGRCEGSRALGQRETPKPKEADHTLGWA